MKNYFVYVLKAIGNVIGHVIGYAAMIMAPVVMFLLLLKTFTFAYAYLHFTNGQTDGFDAGFSAGFSALVILGAAYAWFACHERSYWFGIDTLASNIKSVNRDHRLEYIRKEEIRNDEYLRASSKP